MSDEHDGYQFYLLRLWRGLYRGKLQWRASLENPRTGERQVFAGLEQLFAFLSERCGSQAPATPDCYAEGAGAGHPFPAPGAGGRQGRRQLNNQVDEDRGAEGP